MGLGRHPGWVSSNRWACTSPLARGGQVFRTSPRPDPVISTLRNASPWPGAIRPEKAEPFQLHLDARF
jgi:hypothetical protein